VVAYARPGVSSFGLTALSDIFADRSEMGLPRLDFVVCADQVGTLRTDLGLSLGVEHGPEAMAGADLIVLLPAGDGPLTLPAPVNEAITDAHRRGAIIAAYDTGSFLLADTGLLDGLRATPSWQLASQLARCHPAITVKPGVLYVDEGQVVTGAGAAAGIDMCLHLLRREHGTAVCNAVARDAMLTPRHDSGQPHYVPDPVQAAGTPAHADSEAARLSDLLIWARTRLHQPMTVNDLAKQALMSTRIFARRFRAATGTTPYAWLAAQRLDRARELLENTDLPIQQIAAQVGFHSSSVLRTQFTKRHGVPPSAYRHAFQQRQPTQASEHHVP
jgi:transcriptional regulator GlxA family with amidase domain